MDRDPRLLDPDLTSPKTPEPELIERVCKYLSKNNSSAKAFLTGFLKSTHENMVERRKQWGSVRRGWKTTEVLLDAIADVVNEKLECRPLWNAWVLKKAKLIVASQSLPKGDAYINIKKIDPSFFSHEMDIKREKELINSMSFIYDLIKSKLQHHHDAWVVECEQNTVCQTGESQVLIETDTEYESNSESDATVDPKVDKPDDKISFKSYVYRKSKSRVENAQTRMDSIALAMISMLSYGCNRRRNALQVENAITMLACGVSEKVTQYLHHIGLSACRQSALRGLRVLADKQAKIIETKIKSAGVLGFLICIDNIDMMERVHVRRLEATSKTFHGTWGYVQFLSKELLAGLDPASCTVLAFQQILREDCNKPVDSGECLPDKDEQLRWVLTLKNQIAKVLLCYMKNQDKYKKLNVLKLLPIDQIKAEKPDIHMLKMMDSSDNGSDGIGSLYEELIRQTGLSPEVFARRLLVLEGDLGTCLNFLGLESQRVPSKFPEESLSHLIMIPGAGHTLWNIAQAILLHHWGNPNDKQDLGAWRTVVELGGKKEKPTAKKDFTSMIGWIEKIHEATITYCICDVLELSVEIVKEPVDLATEAFEKAVDDIYHKYFSGSALRDARRTQDQKTQQLLLRIRDFASIVEANRAMSDGDIGRLMLMWKRWSVMIQGLKGLTHYSRYLPRLIRLLTTVLPPPLRHTILHSLLISPTGRSGHFVAKDFFLEVKNWWLKYFYNHAVGHLAWFWKAL